MSKRKGVTKPGPVQDPGANDPAILQLKAQAYDLFVAQTYHNRQVQAIGKRIVEIEQKIEAFVKAYRMQAEEAPGGADNHKSS